jgi:hypothetical protein
MEYGITYFYIFHIYIIFLNTYSMEQSPSWEAKTS